ncbi:uncharacterized protein LOC119647283 isoform X5 [Hermetia illucens]|uniref:uncharacterized protein LOC119647283 isoform X5 n=1 Tax=Hermetia illucens TaxID=343691 RepID=UPI0018CC691A|nr:uncharacterized protein LOC119647283 isoform X5 [Hermetia illucens]XP_037904113.1 uncharacterized protein LOC119647283 isoform X5 [Hermetia illucens]XP_037904114.1 uncharacterized protein LOC119647283 isoform X5 [Hermetia illucens]XP_037904115.1 uncharacterized protein LOC119647283 isoform X5 [Hermetia illucens]
MSCLAPSFTKLVTQVDPFEKLQQIISRALKAFFGYKLYKSLTEKDRKREEKLKAKQAKKKK